MKINRLLCLLAALLLFFSGCTRVGLPIDPTDPGTTEETKRQRDPVEKIASLDRQGNIASIYADGEDHAVMELTSQSQGVLLRELCRMDLETGAVEISVSLSSEETLLGVRENGEIVIADFSSHTVSLLDRTLKRTSSFSTEGWNGYGAYYHKKCDMIWWQDSGDLYVSDMKGAIRRVYDFESSCYVSAFDPESERWIVTAPDSNDETYRAAYCFIGEGGEPSFKNADTYDSYYFSGEDLIRVYSMDVSPSETEIEWEYVAEILNGKGDPVASYESPFGYFLESIPSRFLFNVKYSYPDVMSGSAGSQTASEISVCDFAAGVWGKIPGLPGDAMAVTAGSLGEGDEILLACSWEEGSGRSPEIYYVDAARIPLEERFEPYEAEPSTEPYVLSADLQGVRETADEIEAKYGVRILLGNECLNAESDGFYQFVSMEDDLYPASSSQMIREIRDALELLEKELARYPESFFPTFVSRLGGGGVRFLFLRELTGDYENFSAAAIEYEKGTWYNVAFDIDWMDRTTVHHELWHAVQDRITSENYFAFSSEDWDPLNPPGFEYGYDFDHYQDRDDLSKYLLWMEDDVYFVRIYGTVTPNEDRATIIEEIFGDGYRYMDHPYSSSLEMIADFPHLQEKLDYMAEQVEAVFGEVYWEKMLP